MTSETPGDWQSIFGIPDNAGVDENPEGETYAIGVREAVTPDTSQGALGFSLETPHEVIRLAFAKTAVGANEIASWADGQATDLSVLTEECLLPIHPDGLSPEWCDTQDEEPETFDDVAMVVDAVSAGASIGLLLMLLLLL